MGLDIIELRALWFVLPTWDCEMEKEKIHRKNNLKQQLDDMKNLSRHPVYEVSTMQLTNITKILENC